jgi:hypothetical protein
MQTPVVETQQVEIRDFSSNGYTKEPSPTSTINTIIVCEWTYFIRTKNTWHENVEK